jgi:ribonuclease HI
VSRLEDADLLRLLAKTLDVAALLARYPEVSPQNLREILREAAGRLEEASKKGSRHTAVSVGEKARPLQSSSAEKDECVLYTDGASRGNPGPAGAGAVLLDGRQKILGESFKYLGETTNNEAEYQALVLGLTLAREKGLKRLRLRSDSELVVRQLQGRYKVKHPRLQVLFKKAKGLIRVFKTFHVESVLRDENAHADRLANQAIEEALSLTSERSRKIP